jgi:NADH-quinone oxidoreductase subunit N|tara:strand:+ start:22762 stop:24246 length:1485 start_codon:yes stop_codon:yes gene_type:complete
MSNTEFALSNTQLVALLPLITFATVITIVLLAIPFWRSLKGICALTVVGLLISLATIIWTSPTAPSATPLLVIDAFASLFMTLICLATLAVALLAYDYLKGRDGQQEEFFLLLLLAALGAMVLVCSSHFASFLLGLELLGISLYALISFPIRGLATLEAALKYLILSGVASAFLLFGAALIYAAQGTLSFEQLGRQGFNLAAGSDRLYIIAGSALMLAGIGFKLSLVPFHMWTPDVYQGAPAPVTAFVATVSKGAIFAILLRFFILTDAYEYQSIVIGLSIIAILSMLAGNLLALMQSSIKRILAYSSIAHLGYLLVAFIVAGIAGGAALAVEAASYFLVAYFITTLGAFGIVSIMSSGEQDLDDIASYEGLFSRRPFLAASFTAMLLSLAGIPLTVGFVGKFYIFAAGVQGARWLLLAALIVGSGIGLFYYLRIVFAMTKRSPDQGETPSTQITIPVAGGWVLLSLTGLLVALGIYPTPLIELIDRMVQSLPL